MVPVFLFRVATKSLSTFIAGIGNQGGMSMSNNYDVDFSFDPTKCADLLKRMGDYGITFASGGSTASEGDADGVGTSIPTVSSGTMLKLLCDEAQLPNIQAATGQITGRMLGEGQVNYPHTKVYSDFQLGWMGDANMIPLKFLNLWYGFIFQELDSGGQEILPQKEITASLSTIKEKSSTSTVDQNIRVAYPDSYLCNILITKTDRGADAPNQKAPISYRMLNAFPYSIDAVPLSYGASQIVKITANFYYQKHKVVYNDVSNFQQSSSINLL